MPPTLGEVGASVRAHNALHSGAGRTVAVSIDISGRSFTAIVPEGTSSGEREAINVPGADASRNITEIIVPAFIERGIDFCDQRAVDAFLTELDGTLNKSRLGANSILAVSEACSRAAADHLGFPLFVHLARTYDEHVITSDLFEMPVPHANMLNGGRHGIGGLPVQEVMVVPVGAQSYRDAIDMLTAIYSALGKELNIPASGTEAGFIPTKFNATNGADKVKEALQMMDSVTRGVGLLPGENIFFALDVAASELVDGAGLYWIDERKGWSADEMTQYLASLVKTFPIISIEDGLGENESLVSWARLTTLLKECGVQSVGDDLLVTNVVEIQKAIKTEAVSSVLIKPNQIGTVSETMDAITLARNAGWTTMISHRSKMADNFESDLAVATRARQVKLGPPAKERIAFHNRLLGIESLLGQRAVYAGQNYSKTD